MREWDVLIEVGTGRGTNTFRERDYRSSENDTAEAVGEFFTTLGKLANQVLGSMHLQAESADFDAFYHAIAPKKTTEEMLRESEAAKPEPRGDDTEGFPEFDLLDQIESNPTVIALRRSVRKLHERIGEMEHEASVANGGGRGYEWIEFRLRPTGSVDVTMSPGAEVWAKDHKTRVDFLARKEGPDEGVSLRLFGAKDTDLLIMNLYQDHPGTDAIRVVIESDCTDADGKKQTGRYVAGMWPLPAAQELKDGPPSDGGDQVRDGRPDVLPERGGSQ